MHTHIHMHTQRAQHVAQTIARAQKYARKITHKRASTWTSASALTLSRPHAHAAATLTPTRCVYSPTTPARTRTHPPPLQSSNPTPHPRSAHSVHSTGSTLSKQPAWPALL